MKQRRYSDFFDPQQRHIKEALIFLNHKNVNMWCRYTYDIGIIALTNETTEPYRRLEEIEMDLLEYTDWLIKELEGWEEYEICDGILIHRDRFVKHLHDIAERI